MKRNLPIILGVALVLLSACISLWFFLGREHTEQPVDQVREDDKSEEVRVGSSGATQEEDLEPPDFISVVIDFGQGKFTPDTQTIQAGESDVLVGVMNSSDASVNIKQSKKPDKATSMPDVIVAPGEVQGIELYEAGVYQFSTTGSAASFSVEVVK